jgi:2-oxoglutarate dehydrogenase E1 component
VPPSGAAKKARTAVPLENLQAINGALMAVPEGFTIHRKLERGRERRKAMFASSSERAIDWAAAEELALATILADAIPIRFTGEDVERGTFSHRHGVYHDAVTGEEYVPLQSFPQSKASFEIRNSPLSNMPASASSSATTAGAEAPGRCGKRSTATSSTARQIILDEYLTSARGQVGHGAVAGAAAAARLRRARGPITRAPASNAS